MVKPMMMMMMKKMRKTKKRMRTKTNVLVNVVIQNVPVV